MDGQNFRLWNGVQMPCIGYGTYQVDKQEKIEEALEIGYRRFDTAAHYFNEEAVGKALANSAVKREEIFIATKLWYSDMGYDNAIRAFEDSVKKLGLTYIDLYLIHWPAEQKKYPDWIGTNRETWKALEDLYIDEKIRAIGVCNFMEKHMKPLLEQCSVKPMINQIENHPGFYQKGIAEFCQSEEIQMEAWEPLGGGKGVLDNVHIKDLAEKYGKTPAQICLRWNLQHQFAVIPKTIARKRMLENRDIFEFTIGVEDMNEIDAIPFCGGEGAIVK